MSQLPCRRVRRSPAPPPAIPFAPLSAPRHAPSASRATRASGACAAALLLALAGCGGGSDPAPGGGPAGAGGPPPAMPVTVVVAQKQPVPQSVEAVGMLEGVREVEVRARVAGVLVKQLFREGEPVREGAPLVQIERAPYEIAVDAARAALAQAEVRAEQARREGGRLAALVAERAISQREADDAASNAKAAEAQLAAARAQLREAQLQLSYTQVHAPIPGLAQRLQRSEGALLSPADATPITTLVQTHPIRVRFAVTEDEARALRKARNPTLRLLDEQGQPLGAPGRVDFAGAVVDPRLGTVPLRAELANPDGRWLPGQFVRVMLQLGQQEGVRVPQAAVMSGEQGRFVWIVGAGNKAEPRPVVTGAWMGGDWALRSGLQGGEQVIVDHLMKLRPGAPVAPKAASPAPAASAASAPAPAASR